MCLLMWPIPPRKFALPSRRSDPAPLDIYKILITLFQVALGISRYTGKRWRRIKSPRRRALG